MSESDENKSMPETMKKSKPIVTKKTVTNVIIAKRPKTSVMVLAAISALNEKGGSSIQAIKKYISATYNINSESYSSYIKKFLKDAVMNGELKQMSGRGASGSFKIVEKSIKKLKKKASETTNTGSIKVVSKKVSAGVVKKPKTVAIKTVTKETENKASKVKTNELQKSKAITKPKEVTPVK